MAETNQQTNPYLALLQQEEQAPSTAQLLRMFANLVGGASAGIGQTGTWGGVAPGLMMGIQANAQDADSAEKRRLRQAEIGIQASKWDEERKQRQAEQGAMAGLGRLLTAPGVTAPQQTPYQLGPQGGASAPGPNLTTAGKPLVDYLVAQHNLSPLAASAIVGNLYQESSFNPSATGDSGSAFGLAQWRLDRQTGLRNFAATQNKPVTDPQVQIDYLVSEMRGGDMGAQRAYAGLQQAATPEQANAAMMHFFRPQGYTPANPTGGHGYGQRVANTRALLPQDRPVDPATAPVPGLGPDAAPPAPAPAPRPGLGPRATPPGPGGPQGPVTPGGSPYDPNAPAPGGVPVAQGGGEGEGEVVLPRIGLPFPAQARAPAPPGSVPFPTIPPPAPAAPGQPPPGVPQQAPAGRPPDEPPKIPPPSPMQLSPEAKERLRILTTLPNIKPIQFAQELNKEINAEWQESQKQAVEGWQRQWKNHDRDEGRSYEAHLKEQAKRDAEVLAKTKREQELADEKRKLGYEHKDMIDSESGDVVSVPKDKWGDPKYVPVARGEQRRQDQAAALAERKAGTEQTKAQRDDENKLRDDFNAAPPVKSYRIVVPMLESAKDAVARPTRAADLNLVYAFAKLMDPDSVVRESETAGVVATASVADRLSAYIGQLNGQAMLNPDVRAKLMKELDSRFRALEESYLVHENAYAGIAERRGLDRDNVIIPIRRPKPAEDNKPTGTNTGNVPVYDTSGKRIQ